MKFCSKCQEYKEINNFIKDKSRTDGLHIYCNPCRKAIKKIIDSKDFAKNKRKNYMKKYYQENREILLERSKNYEKSDEQKKRDVQYALEWAKKNPNKVKYYKYGTAQKRIRTHVSKTFREKINKNGLGTCEIMEKYLGYTLQEFYNHLESLFEEGMSWDNYGSGKGKWCIDHIIPESYFNYNSYEDYDFKKCWALDNLKPMWFEKNSSKGNKWVG